jgi:hypothetical protein
MLFTAEDNLNFALARAIAEEEEEDDGGSEGQGLGDDSIAESLAMLSSVLAVALLVSPQLCPTAPLAAAEKLSDDICLTQSMCGRLYTQYKHSKASQDCFAHLFINSITN